ncbi:MAG: GlsB/YeaQ/YmgE family stress response membrane protein [Alphaproteobacteria bacterium]
MGIVSWIVLGLIAGAIAKFIMPGDDPGGFFVTILIGVVGAVIGGFISTALGFGEVSGLNFQSILVAVAGSVVLLIGYRIIKNR